MGNCCTVSSSIPQDHPGLKNPSSGSSISNNNSTNAKLSQRSTPTVSSFSNSASTSATTSTSTSTSTTSSSFNGGSRNLHAFSYNILKNATQNFRSENIIGVGGFGTVFKGWIDENGYIAARPGMGTVIAVKRLNRQSFQGEVEWMAEVHFLGQLHHPNLVKLMGFCSEEHHRLLVYEYVPRGSLENHLFRRNPISWAVRMYVSLCAARGMAFLHDEAVIYRDFKTSNILLDLEYNAKLSDFGMARAGPSGDKTHVSTAPKGTYGYAAPEYIATGHLTMKCDVYSFGVVLLEMLTGRPAVDRTMSTSQQYLVDWARTCLKDKKKIYRAIDPKLEGQYSSKGAQKVADLALCCVQSDAKARPEMREVVEILQSLVTCREPKKESGYHPSPSPSRRPTTPSPSYPLKHHE